MPMTTEAITPLRQRMIEDMNSRRRMSWPRTRLTIYHIVRALCSAAKSSRLCRFRVKALNRSRDSLLPKGLRIIPKGEIVGSGGSSLS